MARINFETRIYSEPGFQKLIEKLGSRILVKGWLIELWEVAQAYWVDGKQPIPEDIWIENEFPEALITCGFAKRTPSGIQARGSEANFSWILQKIEAGRNGGKAGSGRPRDEKGHYLPKREPSETQAGTKRSQASLLLSPSSLLSKVKEEDSKGDSGPEPPKINDSVGYFIGAYVKAFQVRYPGSRPDLRGKVQGQIKTFLKDYPIERAIKLIQTYCQMDGGRGGWFNTKHHDFGTFLENLNGVSVALDRGGESEINWSKVFGDDEKAGVA
jgi:hypothetical protein